jgi:hypothetical protein
MFPSGSARTEFITDLNCVFRLELLLLQRDYQEEVTAELCKVQDLVLEIFC